MLKKEDLTRIGFVNKTVGFKGELSCITDISRPEKLLKADFLFLILEGLPVPFAVEEMEIRGNDILVKFEDIDSEISAKKLLRKEIYSQKLKGKASAEVISWKSLVDFTVTDTVHGELGKIFEVMEFPMQYIAKCMYRDKEILFPLNDDIVIEINEDEKRIQVELPDGLLDVYLN